MAGTQWVRLDVGYFSNPKVLRAGRDAALMHLAAICYLGAHERDDGVLPAEAVNVLGKLVKVTRPGEVAERLVKHSLWHNADGDYLVHDYDVTNGGRSEAAAARERQRRRREKQRLNQDPRP